MSLIMSCCVPSEQANIVVSATMTPGSSLRAIADGRDVDVVGDVAAAVADVHADATLFGLFGLIGGLDAVALLVHTGTTSVISAWVQMGSHLGDCRSGVQDRVDDVLGACGGPRYEDAGDVGLARVDLRAWFCDVVVLVQS